MIKTLMLSLKIDMTYAINSFIYSLRKLPVFRDLLTDNAYQSKLLKNIVRILDLILFFFKMFISKLFYFYIIYLISDTISPSDKKLGFIHIYFLFTIIGMFINNKLLNTNTKKYFSIVLFGMDAKEYMKSSLFWNLSTTTIFNSLCFLIFSNILNIHIFECLLLIFFGLFVRLIGEALNMAFYKKFNYIWYNNTTLYFTILIVLLLISLLPYLSIFVSFEMIFISTISSFILGIIGLIYLLSITDYQLIYKKLNTKNMVMSKENRQAYSRQAMVEVRKKDIDIDFKKLENKKGFELFNAIFFERHREILLRSAKKYSLVIAGCYFGLIIFVFLSNSILLKIHEFLLYNLGWFVIIMYFINRGAIVTQAMFFNCDHAMLTYNFYREPKVLLGLFKKRLITVVKINLLPAIVIAFGNSLLLYFTGGASLLTYITTFIFILLLSVFFSVHYMVIYYLLQPFNKEMEMKKPLYSLVLFITYFVSYQFSDLLVSSVIFSILGVLFTLGYIALALFLVYKKAPVTFKIN